MEAWEDNVIGVKDKDKAKQAYSDLYNNLHSVVLWVQPDFVITTKSKVLDSNLLQENTHLTNEDSNVHYIEKEAEEPGKLHLSPETSKKVKEAAIVVHDVALEV